MTIERNDPPPRPERQFESEPADEFRESYGRGGPVRSDEPERDFFFEGSTSPADAPDASDEQQRQVRRMRWRADGTRDAPGRALEQLFESSHRGKGPKGYVPNDARLRENICERLTDDQLIDATNIEVSIGDGAVTLSGNVATQRMKQAAEQLVAALSGVTEITNSIVVSSPEK